MRFSEEEESTKEDKDINTYALHVCEENVKSQKVKGCIHIKAS